MEQHDASIVITESIEGYDAAKASFSIVNEAQISIYNRAEALNELYHNVKIRDFAWAKLWRRELFDKERFPVGRTYEDIDTIFRLFRHANRVVYSTQRTYFYLRHQGAITDFSHHAIEKSYDILSAYNHQLSFLRERPELFADKSWAAAACLKKAYKLKRNSIK